MPRANARFTQAEVARALRAVKQAGVRMKVNVLPDGTIQISPDNEAPQEQPTVPVKKIVIW